MRTVSQVVLAILLTVSLGCNKSENSVTGLPGIGRALSGQIVPVGDLAGASPAGINVSSAGQFAVTDPAGRFTFMSLPADTVQLAFSRADGISARAAVSATASTVVVELQKTQAAVVSTGQSKREIEGLILAVSATEITVNDARTGGPLKAAISSTTVIRHGNQTLSATDLSVGDRVHVKATVHSDGSLTAFEIILQKKADDGDDGNGGGQVKELEGLILTVSASEITVQNASTGRPETARITPDTVIRRGNKRLGAGDLKTGDRVHVKTTGPADALVATEIILQNPGR